MERRLALLLSLGLLTVGCQGCDRRGAESGVASNASAPSSPGVTSAMPSSMPSSSAQPGKSEPSKVEIVKQGEGFALLRNGEPYVIRGIGGRTRIEEAAALGANSIRTWHSEDAEAAFAAAAQFNLTVFAGLWLSQDPKDYVSDAYKAKKRAELTDLLTRYANNPHLLVWALGNEIQLGADVPEAWQFIEELAQLVLQHDKNHPIATVTAHAPLSVIRHILQYAPSISLLGVNSYGGLENVPRELDAGGYHGPFVITEWGPDGHWEVTNTSWGRPIEQSSAEKARMYEARYHLMQTWQQRCFGSYVFLWGQKQERTSTWYGVFVEDRPELGLHGEAMPPVDALASAWSGKPVTNPAPQVSGLLLNGKKPTDNVILSSGQPAEAQAQLTDVGNSSQRFVWELLQEPTQLGKGGSFEPRPPTVAGALTPNGSTATLKAPSPGEYRLFFYALDDAHHKVGTANFPFKVQ